MSTPRSSSRSLGQRSLILPVHKPVGMTSRSVVDQLQNKLDISKIGHGGTLDPLAEGVLPLHFNEATKVVEYLHENPKTYRVRCRFDFSSASRDLGEEVRPVESDTPNPSREEMKKRLQSFQGSQLQTPPTYSAIKVEGKPMYEWARSADRTPPNIESRQVECHFIRLLHYDYPSLTFEISCGKGFYVRSLVRDLAKTLNQPGGIVTVLVRTQYGPYSLNSCAKLHDNTEQWHSSIFSIPSALRTIPIRECDNNEIQRLTNGGRIPRTIKRRDRAAAVDSENYVHALLEPATRNPDGEWKPKRVLNRKRPTITS